MKVTHELLKYGVIRSGDYVRDLAYSENPLKFVEGVSFNQWDGSYTLRTSEIDAQGNKNWNEYSFRPSEPQTASIPYTAPYVPKTDFEVAPESVDLVRLRILELVETKGKAVQELLELLRTMVKA